LRCAKYHQMPIAARTRPPTTPPAIAPFLIRRLLDETPKFRFNQYLVCCDKVYLGLEPTSEADALVSVGLGGLSVVKETSVKLIVIGIRSF
jgi:hypothetical protein